MNEKTLTTKFLLGLLSFNMMDFHKSAMHYDPLPAPPKKTFDTRLLIFQQPLKDLNDFLANLTGPMFIKS